MAVLVLAVVLTVVLVTTDLVLIVAHWPHFSQNFHVHFSSHVSVVCFLMHQLRQRGSCVVAEDFVSWKQFAKMNMRKKYKNIRSDFAPMVLCSVRLCISGL